MTNKNYDSGRKFEYDIKEMYETLGYEVYRSAGSHTPVDLIAVNEIGVLFIQCKRGRLVKKDLASIIKLAKKYNKTEHYDFRVANLAKIKVKKGIKKKGKKKFGIIIYWITPAGKLIKTES